MNMRVCKEHTSNKTPIQEDYHRDVYHGLLHNTSAFAIHWPSTKRHIMPRTRGWCPATTSSYTLNDHTTRSADLAQNCTYQ